MRRNVVTTLFSFLILIGPFLVLQLLLVVLADNFEDKLGNHEALASDDTQALHDEFLKALTHDDDDYDIPGITPVRKSSLIPFLGFGNSRSSSVGIDSSDNSSDPSLSPVPLHMMRQMSRQGSLSRRESRRSSDLFD